MKPTLKSILLKKQFFPLLVAQFLGAFNDNFFKNALAILVTYQIIQTSALRPEVIITIASAIFVLPFFLFSALAGQLADKFEKAKLIKIIKFCEIIIALLALYGFMQKNLTLLMATLFLLAVQFSMFGPVKYSFLPERLAENELIASNGLLDASTFIAILLGTIFGGVIAGFHNTSVALVGIILVVVAIIGFSVSVLLPKGKAASPALTIDHNIFRSTGKILHDAIKGNRTVFLAILGASWFWLFGFVILSQFPEFTAQILHASSGMVTLFLALFTIGIAVGSILCNKLMNGELKTSYIPASIFGMSLFLFDCVRTASHINANLATSPTLISLSQFMSSFAGWHIAFDLFAIAVCGGIYIVPIYVIMQAIPKKEQVSRIIAANNIWNAIFMVGGTLLTWVLLSLHLSITAIFFVLACLNTIVAIYICKLIPEAVVRSFIKWLLTVLFRVHVSGLENVKQADEPFLVVANHNSFLDALLIAAFFPKNLVFAVNTTVAKSLWMRMLFGLVKLYPIDPTNPMATKGLINELNKGHNVMIFPEGRITNTGALMKVYEGPGVIAANAGASILPIRIDGAQYSLFSRLKHRVKRRLFPKISLTIMPATKIDIDPKVKGRERRHIIANNIYDLMSDLIFSSTDCDKTLFTKLLEARSIYGRNKKIIEDIERKPASYQALLKLAFVFAQYLRKTTASDAKIGIMLPNGITALGLFFGCQIASRIPAMMNYTAGSANVDSALKAADIKTLITSRQFVEKAKLTEIIASLDKHVAIIYLEDLLQKISIWNKLLGTLYSKLPTLTYRYLFKPSDFNNPAVILFTSGSEGTPKGVALSHKNILTNCAQLGSRVDFHGQDTVFNALPNFHSFGLTGGILLPLLAGIKSFHFPNPLQYRVIPELVYDSNATILFGTDTFLSGYARCAHPYDFYAVRYVFAGAEKLHEETRKTWHEKFGIRIMEGYGATEASPIISTNTPMYYQAGSVGRLLPGISYRLEQVPGIDVGKKLLVKGNNIALGYYKTDKPGTLQAFASEWYDTGDIVSFDSDGFIKILGRAKRFAKIAGEMISLTQVEEIIANNWSEDCHAAISLPDDKKGEKIVLVTTAQNITKDDILQVITNTGGNTLMVPKEIIVVDSIPMLGSGKVNYVALTKNLSTNP